MKAIHTPDPWIAKIEDTDVSVWSEDYGGVAHICDNAMVYREDGNEPAAEEAFERMIADAKLMAAAPDMLKACQAFLEYDRTGDMKKRQEVYWKVRDALQKAI